MSKEQDIDSTGAEFWDAGSLNAAIYNITLLVPFQYKSME